MRILAATSVQTRAFRSNLRMLEAYDEQSVKRTATIHWSSTTEGGETRRTEQISCGNVKPGRLSNCTHTLVQLRRAGSLFCGHKRTMGSPLVLLNAACG